MKLAITSLALAMGLAMTGQASAVTVNNVMSAQATTHCQGSLPAFETAFRKRPLSYKNEGTASSFVTCAFPINAGAAIAGSAALDVYFGNESAASVTVTCNAVNGWFTGTNEYSSKSVTIAAGAQGDIVWSATDFPTNGLDDGLITLSCSLPPSVGINDTYTGWQSNDATAAQ